MRVLMTPHLSSFAREGPSGIRAVIEAYFEHLPAHGLDLVEADAESYDLHANHAGLGVYAGGPLVAHVHGLYWSGDYPLTDHHHSANFSIAHSMRVASAVVVPSPWLTVPLQRDMRLMPHVVPHGIDLARWHPHPQGHANYVLWNKNRPTDACSPRRVNYLARHAPSTHFLSTFSDPDPTPNLLVTGVLAPDEMRGIVAQASVYLSTAKETFGIGILEALACGVPVLAVDHGNARALVHHGETGYLVAPGDDADLLEGLHYCLQHRDRLSANCRDSVADYTWERVAAKLAVVYQAALDRHHRPHDVSVVIPCYNKAATLERAVRSALNQTLPPARIIVSNNNSTDDSYAVAKRLEREHPTVSVLMGPQPQGVAHARNLGVAATDTRYVCCLDADDEIRPDFLAVCVAALRAEPHLGLAYTKLEGVQPDGATQTAEWPPAYDFAGFLRRQNQVPTCCVFRRDLFDRLGGYRQRYAPQGAGAEDVELWLRMGATGYPGRLASTEPLFRYHFGGATQRAGYSEPDWLYWHPWAKDAAYPFACSLAPGIHPVRSYADPQIAICIPCLDLHIPLLWDALDSIEAQGYRDYEVAVVFDLHDKAADAWDRIEQVRVAYPYVRFDVLIQAGAGAARNRAVALTTAPHLLFLDADDRLELDCLAQLIEAARQRPGEILYTDYTARMYLHETGGAAPPRDVLHHDPTDGFTLVRYRAADYDCARALRQPEDPYYQWNLVSSLTPRAAHERIGGFDETMASWEDWDYWLRAARAGVCFHRIGQPLFSYNFQSGVRREIGRNQDAKLLDYLVGKYQKEETMGCSGCSGGRRASSPVAMQQIGRSFMSNAQMSARAQNMVRVEYIESAPTGKPVTLRDANGQQINYGFRRQGDLFLMQRQHAEAFPNRFKIVEAMQPPDPPPAATGRRATPSDLEADVALMKEGAKAPPPPAPEPSAAEKVLGDLLKQDDEETEDEPKSGSRRGRRKSG